MLTEVNSSARAALLRALALGWFAIAVILPVAGAAQGDSAGEVVAPASRNVTPPGILPGPSLDGPLVREATPEVPPDPPRWHRFHLPETPAAGTFVANGLTVHLSGAAAPRAGEACGGHVSETWPCGNTARHNLRMFLRGRAVECYFPFTSGVSEIVAPCRVGSTDIALWLIGGGWARADDLATEAYRQSEKRARCAGLGIWRGRTFDDCPRESEGAGERS